MLTQNLQQTYATTTQSLFNAFTSKEYLEMSQESSIVSQYYSLAGGPKQYYIIIQPLICLNTFSVFTKRK
jgi:hypothetical protein